MSRRKLKRPPPSLKRLYCPKCCRKVGRVEAPARCPKCGLDGVSLASRRALSRERGRARRKEGRPTWYQKRRADYEAYINGAQWGLIRQLVLVRDGGACLLCSSRERLHVHHINYETFTDETGEELATLCARCHEAEHELPRGRRRMVGPYERVRLTTLEREVERELTDRLAREA